MDLLTIILIALLVTSNVFWAFSTHKLVNKLMSKDFSEYVSTNLMGSKVKAPPPKAPLTVADDVMDQVNALNSLIG